MQQRIRPEEVAPQHNQKQRRSSKNDCRSKNLRLLKEKRLLRRKSVGEGSCHQLEFIHAYALAWKS